MAPTKRYDVSGKDRGDGRLYPQGTILKLDDKHAEAMGLKSSDRSSMTTTADDPKKRADFERQQTAPASTKKRADFERQQTAPASTKKRGAKDKAAE